jgi:predicted nucleic acid-binding protein
MFDANILLDVFQKRQPHYPASAGCVNRVLQNEIEGSMPAHVLTAFYYVMEKHLDAHMARETVSWLLERFSVAPCDHSVLESACRSDISDFEDAVVAVSAESSGCSYILTRNSSDFSLSSVPVLSPNALLEMLSKA